MNKPSLFLIAGETSGDQLGGWLMEALKKQRPDILFSGIGGPMMEAQGLTSRFPMREISLMGFAEILPHIFRLKRLIRETVETIEREKPDMLITIDSPGFNTRVVQQLRARGIHRPQCVHYVAPTVWAYKPKRAEKFAALFDYLLCILPFESPYFDAVKLPNRFVGHEIAWWWKSRGDAHAFRTKYQLGDGPLLAVFPGSRGGEIARHWPVFAASIAQLRVHIPNFSVVVQVPEALVERMQNEVAVTGTAALVLPNTADKKNLFAASTAAIAKSGTIGLECALAGLPSVIAYRANPISIWLIRRMVNIPYANLANLLAGRMVIPELLQEACTPERLTSEMLPLLTDAKARESQAYELSSIAAMLGVNEPESPSTKAASTVLTLLDSNSIR